MTQQYCLTLVAGLASAALVHCSSDRDSFESNDAGSSPGAFVDASQEASLPEPDVDCADENKQIYLLSAIDASIHRLYPATLTITPIGKIPCLTSAGAFSMAVDRRGYAWVEYQDGRVFKVNTADMSCTDTGFRSDPYGFGLFGMGFAKNDGDTSTGVSAGETLWVAGASLGRIDTTTMALTLVGKGGLGVAELTGTGKGTLFAFLRGGGRVAQLDKVSGDVDKYFRTGLADGPYGAYAFAQWGGDFYLFTLPATGAPSTTSTLTRYSPATDTSEVLMQDMKLRVAGAGVSTCAPTDPR